MNSVSDLTPPSMRVRDFQVDDAPALFRVFHSAIHMIASRDYTPEQVKAWAPDEVDADLWLRRMLAIRPFVVQEGGEIVGYADLQPNGYIDHFFVSGHHPRRGIGRLLMQRIHEQARVAGLHELISDVSRTAEPFYTHFGFVVLERKQPVVRGVTVPNALMRKDLRNTSGEA